MGVVPLPSPEGMTLMIEKGVVAAVCFADPFAFCIGRVWTEVLPILMQSPVAFHLHPSLPELLMSLLHTPSQSLPRLLPPNGLWPSATFDPDSSRTMMQVRRIEGAVHGAPRAKL